MTGYDVIGDIHGSAEELTGLLGRLGWRADDAGVYRHDDDLLVVFAGDLVDRGPGQRRVLEIVRSMVDAGTARAVMGNHEFNHVGIGTDHPNGSGPLKARTEDKLKQGRAFLDQIPEPERPDWLEWFRTLPLWLDLGGLRVVHACWHQDSIDFLEQELGGTHLRHLDDWARAHDPDQQDPVWEAVEVLLKGPEIELAPYGLPAYVDGGDTTRGAARARWWNRNAKTIADLIDIPDGTKALDGTPYPSVPEHPFLDHDDSFAYTGEVPVIYGHHWRTWSPSEHLDYTDYTACVDFSAVRGGPLVAYRWRGESTINPDYYLPHLETFDLER